MSALPEQAVDPLVLNHITQAPGLVAQHGSVDDHPCGCRWNDYSDRWHLCRYHDGMNDGLAMAAPNNTPPPTTDELVWTTNRRTVFHLVQSCACGSRTPEAIPLTVSRALAAGLTPCGVCSRHFAAPDNTPPPTCGSDD